MTIVAEESFVAEKTFTLRSGSGAGSVGSGVSKSGDTILVIDKEGAVC